MVLSQRIEHRLHDKSMALIVNEGKKYNLLCEIIVFR